MADAKVSVIVPTYNRPKRLRRALQSIQQQTYNNIEVVVVDDHSTTSVKDVVQSFLPELSIKFFRHSENKGGNAARNTGIVNSCGSYVAFLDDDDTWEPSKIERQMNRIESSDAGVVYTGIRHVGKDGDTVTQSTPTSSEITTEDLLKKNLVGSFSTVLVKRDVIYGAGLPDQRFPIWQDKEWYIRLSQCATFAAVPSILVNHHVGSSDRISDGFDELESEALPLFIKNHQQTIKEQGWVDSSQIYSSVYANVSRYGLATGNHDKAKEYAIKSLLRYPVNTIAVIYFMLALDNGRLYRYYQQLSTVVQLFS